MVHCSLFTVNPFTVDWSLVIVVSLVFFWKGFEKNKVRNLTSLRRVSVTLTYFWRNRNQNPYYCRHIRLRNTHSGKPEWVTNTNVTTTFFLEEPDSLFTVNRLWLIGRWLLNILNFENGGKNFRRKVNGTKLFHSFLTLLLFF